MKEKFLTFLLAIAIIFYKWDFIQEKYDTFIGNERIDACGYLDVFDTNDIVVRTMPQEKKGNEIESILAGSTVDLIECVKLDAKKEKATWLKVRTVNGNQGWIKQRFPSVTFVLYEHGKKSVRPQANVPGFQQMQNRFRRIPGIGALFNMDELMDCIMMSSFIRPSCDVKPSGSKLDSIILDFLPGIGDMKGLWEALNGVDMVTGEILDGSRWMGALFIAEFAVAERAIVKEGKVVIKPLQEAKKELKALDTVADIAKSSEKSLKAIGCSFSADTPVITINGYTPISKIKAEDKVLGYREDIGKIAFFDVITTFSQVDTTLVKLTIDGELLTTTPEHPFYAVGKGWIEADKLTVGTKVRTLNGDTSTVQKKETVKEVQRMYNLAVNIAHNYFVGKKSVLVHNECPTFKAAKNAGEKFYRGGNDLLNQIERDIVPTIKGAKIEENPLLTNKGGISIYTNSQKAAKHGTPHIVDIDSLPKGLTIRKQGQDIDHYIIVPDLEYKEHINYQEFIDLLKNIVLHK